MLPRNLYQFTKMALSNSAVNLCFVQNGKKILGAGVNYNEILKVKNVPKPEAPIIFMKPTTSYIEEGQSIIIPKGFKVNEEIELGVVIGKTCKSVKEKDALDYVAGYCLALDLTATSELTVAREKGMPWTLGKGFDTACPVSRFITKKEITDPSKVELWVKVNGEIRQESSTSDLIFSVPYLVSFISKFITLEAGDLILTGTPPGMSEIKPGDVIEGGIKDLITIKFPVKCSGHNKCP